VIKTSITLRFYLFAVVGFFVMCFAVSNSFAAESTESWRPLYDLIMRYVNFLILVFFIIRFGKAPVKKFLYHKKKEISEEITHLEKQKEEALKKVDSNAKALEDSHIRFEKLRERIVRQGRAARDRIVEDAGQESRILIAGAKRKADYQIQLAKEELRSELLNAAFELAIKKIPKHVTKDDSRRLNENFISTISVKAE